MAGMILPPEVLSTLTVLYFEGDDEQTMLDLPDGVTSYTELSPWQKSRMTLPKVTLDGVTLVFSNETMGVQFDCVSPDRGSFTMSHITQDMLQEVSYHYNPATSLMFLAVALSLRYKAPLTLVDETNDKDLLSSLLLTEQDLLIRFPLYTTVGSLSQSSQRVTQNIEQSFEVHKLTGALKMAMDRGDTVAAQSIRERLDAFDSLDDLPILGEDPDDEGSSQDDTSILQ